MAPGPPKEFGARKVPLRFRPYLLVILLICPLLAASPAWPGKTGPANPKLKLEKNVAGLQHDAWATELVFCAQKSCPELVLPDTHPGIPSGDHMILPIDTARKDP